MKISKFLFLKILGKHLVRKMGKGSLGENDTNILAASLDPMFSTLVPLMVAEGIMHENQIDIDKLEVKFDEFFSTFPIFNIPYGQENLTITKIDAKDFIKDLNKHGTVDEVIYLPCQN